MKKIFLVFVFLTVSFLGLLFVNAVSVTMSSDVSSFPGAGSVPANSIGSYVNTGYRMYIVDRKTGNLAAGTSIIDIASPNNSTGNTFYKTSSQYRKTTFVNQAIKAKIIVNSLPKSSLVEEKGNLKTMYINSFAGVPFPTNWTSGSKGESPVNDFHNQLKNIKVKYKGEYLDISKYNEFANFLFTTVLKDKCSYSNMDCKIKEYAKFTAINDEKEQDENGQYYTKYYLIYEPLIFYRIFDAYYALTATESAMIFNSANFGNWWTGVTVYPDPIYNEFDQRNFVMCLIINHVQMN